MSFNSEGAAGVIRGAKTRYTGFVRQQSYLDGKRWTAPAPIRKLYFVQYDGALYSLRRGLYALCDDGIWYGPLTSRDAA